MMFTMWPASSRSWPSSSMENVYTFDSKSNSVDQFAHCPEYFPTPTSSKVDAGTQTDNEMFQQRCNRVTLALVRFSMDLEMRLDLSINFKTDPERPTWLELIDSACALFTACFRPVVLR